jgi:hypothetical protein
MIPILIFTNILFLGGLIFMIVKNKKFNKKIKEFESINTNRIGFYKRKFLNGECTVWIKELDRYNNGFCKIELTKVENNSSEDWYDRQCKTEFCSLRRVSDIEWCESENRIKEERKHKLEQIKKLYSKGL